MRDYLSQFKRDFALCAAASIVLGLLLLLYPDTSGTILAVIIALALAAMGAMHILNYLFRRFPDLQVTGIDLSATMLDQLRASYPGRDLRLVQADYTAWDLGEREYDGALSFETLHHLLPEEKEKLYVKLFQALRPGGCYVECDYVACCQEEQDLCRDHYEHRRAKYQVHPGQFVHIDIPLTLERQLELLDRAGFRCVQVLHQRECTAILKAYRPG